MVAPPFPIRFFSVLALVPIAIQAGDVRVPESHFFMSLVGSSAARTFPPHPGQACALAEGKKWATSVRRILPPDWTSLVNGSTPRSLLQYNALTVPAALVFQVADPANNVPGIPQTSVLARDLEIAKSTDINAARLVARAAHAAELANEFFVALEVSLADASPLLLDKLRADHEQAYNAGMHDGPAAFLALCARYDPAHIGHPEASEHDDFLLRLRFHPLATNCEPARFEERVSDAMKHHIPFLERPFKTQRKVSEWVISQLPPDLAADGRRLEDTLTVAQFGDPEVVARLCFTIVQKAHSKVSNTKGGMAEFLGQMSDAAPGAGAKPGGGGGDSKSGRRPSGLKTGTTAPSGKPASKPRATECSNTHTARGATCKLAHPAPCFRDNLWAGPVPRRLWDNKDALASIEKDRTAGAKQRGETVTKLVPAPPTETLSLLYDDDEAHVSPHSAASTMEEMLSDDNFDSQCGDAVDSTDEQIDEAVLDAARHNAVRARRCARRADHRPFAVPGLHPCLHRAREPRCACRCRCA